MSCIIFYYVVLFLGLFKVCSNRKLVSLVISELIRMLIFVEFSSVGLFLNVRLVIKIDIVKFIFVRKDMLRICILFILLGNLEMFRWSVRLDIRKILMVLFIVNVRVMFRIRFIFKVVFVFMVIFVLDRVNMGMII